MIRTLILMGIMGMSIFIASGCIVCVEPGPPLDRTVRETLDLVKTEVRNTIILTTEKVKCNGHYDIKGVSKMEALPYPGRRKHHKPEEKRRSMVSVIWNLLPASLSHY